MPKRVALSVVVPVFNGAATVPALIEALAGLEIQGGLEVVLVDDGSRDDSAAVCGRLARDARIPVTVIEHARNYGEHNALMTGLRFARGEFVVTMDDDLQNPPHEVVRLYDAARGGDLDVVYGVFAEKKHAWWRNIGSRIANRTADIVIDKPRGLYLSSFRCMRRFVVERIVAYDGPFPYVDGLIFQITRRAGSIAVEHRPRGNGASNYSFVRLMRLWLTILVNFSVLPLRISTVLGLCMSVLGGIGIAYVFIDYLIRGGDVEGWPSLMLTALIFSGTQLLILGLLGEYLGRVYLTLNRRPQGVIRSMVLPADAERDAATPPAAQ